MAKSKRANLFSNKQQKPADSTKVEAAKLKVLDIENAIKNMELANISIPKVLTDELSELKHVASPNKMNAKKHYYDGREFDSVREGKFAEWLDKEFGFKYKVDYFEETGFELQPSFALHGKTLHPITIYPDFVIKSRIIVDTKGAYNVTQGFKDKWKMLQYLNRDNYYYFRPETETEVKAVKENIKLILKNEGLL